MKIWMLFFLALSTCVFGSPLDDSQASEFQSVSLRDVKIYHQNSWRHLTLHFEYEGHLDNLEIKSWLKQFLEEYSHPDDFWEIMNAKLVKAALKTYPEITALKSTLALEPDESLFTERSSIITYEQGQLHEFFGFLKVNYKICQERLFAQLTFMGNGKCSPIQDLLTIPTTFGLRQPCKNILPSNRLASRNGSH